jgi:hypothetical protein
MRLAFVVMPILFLCLTNLTAHQIIFKL